MQNQNQFSQTPEKGELAFRKSDDTVGAMVAKTVVGDVLPGQAMKIVGTSKGVFQLEPTNDPEEKIFGYVVRDFKDAKYKAGDLLSVTKPFAYATLYMQSAGAILAGAETMLAANQKVATLVTGANNIASGLALDNATAADQIIRVMVLN